MDRTPRSAIDVARIGTQDGRVVAAAPAGFPGDNGTTVGTRIPVSATGSPAFPGEDQPTTAGTREEIRAAPAPSFPGSLTFIP
jgi:hypothetical protein